jgi:tight adherence protein B
MAPEILRAIILILIFGTVLLGVEGLAGWFRNRHHGSMAINKRLRMIASGIDRSEVMARLRINVRDANPNAGILTSAVNKLSHMLHAAGIGTDPGTFMVFMIGGMIAIFAIMTSLIVLFGRALSIGNLTMVLVIAIAIAIGLPLMVLSRISDSRRKKVTAQFPVALDVFVRGLRAGHPIASALDLLTHEMPDPIGSEFGLVVDEVTYGAEFGDALQAMADRWNLSDMQMFAVCLAVQRETGGNLSEILENLASVIRERAAMYMQVRALSSEGRMTGVMLTALPILALVGLFLTNPSFYLDVTDDPIFLPGFLGLIGLYFTGFFMIRRMVDLKV